MSGQCDNCRADRINGLCLRCAEALQRQNEAMREALLFIRDECDWDCPREGGDPRIGEACTKALSPTAGSDLVTREEHESVLTQRDQVLHLLSGGALTEDEVKASGLGTGVLTEQRHHEYMRTKAEGERDQLRAQLTAFSNSITALCLAIDPDSTHGPESAKIAAYATETRKLAAELTRSAFSSNAHYRLNKANEMKRHLGMPPDEPANQGRLTRDEEWSLLANQVVGAEVFPPGMEMLKAQLTAATQRAEKAEAAIHECEEVAGCPDRSENPARTNLPNIIRQLRVDKEKAEASLLEVLQRQKGTDAAIAKALGCPPDMNGLQLASNAEALRCQKEKAEKACAELIWLANILSNTRTTNDETPSGDCLVDERSLNELTRSTDIYKFGKGYVSKEELKPTIAILDSAAAVLNDMEHFPNTLHAVRRERDRLQKLTEAQ